MHCVKRTILAALTIVALSCDMPQQPKPAEGVDSAPAQGKAQIPAFSGSAVEDGQWLITQKDYANTRYSGLRQINTSNVDQLKALSTFSTGMVAGMSGVQIGPGATQLTRMPRSPSIWDRPPVKFWIAALVAA